MATDGHIHSFSAADIEKYQQGRLSAAEMHAMEKAALEDPFLADAMEGYADAGPSLQADLADLRQRLDVQEKRARVVPLVTQARSSYTWLKVAAMAVIVFGAAFLVYQLGFADRQPVIAMEQTVAADTQAATDRTSLKTDSTPVVPGENLAASKAPVVIDNPKPAGNKQAGTANNDDLKSPAVAAKQPAVQAAPVREDAATLLPAAPSLPQAEVVTRDKAAPVNETAKKAEQETERKLSATQGYGQAKAKRAAVPAEGFTSQSNTFRGRVFDENNNALPFANITNAQDNVGTYTDARGNFILTSPDSILDVRVRSLGYSSQTVELKPGNAATANRIIMDESGEASDVVISRQTVNSSRPRNSGMVLEESEPVDGWRNYDTYIANNLQVPENEKSRPGRSGEVELSFEVDKKGEPVNITVTKSLCESCDREAIRLLKAGPKWKRKTKQGRTVVTIPF
ncbi:MAG: hypothetical protein EOO09_06665 [Chitinophagaceae bacterium]|nr:MAG: hypothetical protein EOO09_06665 [Chitinophagaceae bacterium]